MFPNMETWLDNFKTFYKQVCNNENNITATIFVSCLPRNYSLIILILVRNMKISSQKESEFS